MSVKCMARVWDSSTVGGTELLVLLAIADHAHDDGSGAWPAVSSLAKKCKVSERTIQRTIRSLREKGELGIITGGGPYGTNAYCVTTQGGGDNLSPRQNVTGDTYVTPPVTPMSPKPSFNHHLKDKEEDSKRPNIFAIYESNIGSITKIMADKLIQAEKDYSEEWITEAVSIAVTNNARKWSYVEAILKDWQTNGYKNDKRKPARANSKTSSEPAGFANLRKAAERWSGNNE